MGLGSRWSHHSVRIGAILALTVSLAGSARSAPGDLDASFGGDGTVVSSLGLPSSPSCTGLLQRLAVGADGKVVVSVLRPSAGPVVLCDHSLIARFDRDGTLDSTFDDGSGVPGTVEAGQITILAVAIQPDGKVVIAGYRAAADPGGTDQAVIRRYLANGDPDPTFGVAGERTFDTTSGDDSLIDNATALAIQPGDGKLVIGGANVHLGSVGIDFWGRWFVARFTTTGDLDPSFGGGAGYVVGPHNASQWGVGALALAADGAVLAHVLDTGYSDLGVVRVATDGTRDLGFGAGGLAPSDLGVYAMAVDAGSGRIAVTGFKSDCTDDDEDPDWAVHVLTSSGQSDSSFSGDGWHCIDDGRAGSGFFQDDGRLVVGGTLSGATFVRYQVNGTEDPSFGSAGRSVVDFGTGAAADFARAARWGHKVVGFGSLYPDAALARAQLEEVVVDPPIALKAGSAIHLTGAGITPGTRLKMFLATSSGALDVVYDGIVPSATNTAHWYGTLPYPWPLPAPFDTSLGNGFVALQFVRTDVGYSVSPLTGALLLGNAALAIPSIESLGGASISPTSTDLSIATANVELVVPRGANLVMRGEGFANPVVNVFTASGNVGPLTPSTWNATELSVPIPAGAPIGPGSFQVVNTTTWRVSNAVSAPIGEAIDVTSAVYDEDAFIYLTGSGFNALTVVNLFGTFHEQVINKGGLDPDGTPKLPLTITDSQHAHFRRPTGLDPGAAYVQALNPPFIPYTSSGTGPGGSLTLP